MEFKAEVKVSELREVEISEVVAHQITEEFLRKLFDLPEHCYIDKERFRVKINSGHRHVEDVIHREAKHIDQKVLDILQAIKEIRYASRSSGTK